MRFFSLDLSLRQPLRGLLAGALAVATCGAASGGQSPQAGPQLQLDGMPFNGAAHANAKTQQIQIRTLAQSADQRVPPHVIVLPALTGAKAAELPAAKPGQPLQIGVGRDVPAAADAAATASLLSWSTAADGRQRAAISVQATGAQGLRLGLRVEQLPPGALLRVYAPGAAQTTEVAGAEVLRTLQRNRAAGASGADASTYWLPVVEGPEAALEIQLPAGTDPAQLKVSLPQITQLQMLPTSQQALLKSFSGTPAGACNIDVMCTTGNSNTMHAVALMLFNIGDSGYLCSGTLMNDANQDHKPYFLSANHCISTQAAASSLITIWNYRLAACGSSQLDSSSQEVDGGAQLLYATPSTDTSFMLLNAPPPANAYLAGWDARTPATLGESIFDIHYPSGDLEKYSQGNVNGFLTCSAEGSNGSISCSSRSSNLGTNTFYNVAWSSGVTEGGSSGSPLFSSSGTQVVGQLFGGSSSCSNPGGNDVFGRFDLAFNAALSKWLSPAASTTPPLPPAPSAGIYQIINADGTPGDYLAVYSYGGGGIIASIYGATTPSSGTRFTLTDGGTPVANLYQWNRRNLFNGSLTGTSSATLTGDIQYGLCSGTVNLTFNSTGGTIRIVPNGPSSIAPPGSHPSCSATGAEPTLAMTGQSNALLSANDGIYLDAATGQYMTVYTSPVAGVIVSVYGSTHPSQANSFALTDAGASVATLYRWDWWELYSGTRSGNSVALSGMTQYGLCSASGTLSLGSGGNASLHRAPTGLSEFATPGTPGSACAATGTEPTLSFVRQF